MVSLLVALHVEEGVAVPELVLPGAAERDGGGLAVAHQHLPGGVAHIRLARRTIQPLQPGGARPALGTHTGVSGTLGTGSLLTGSPGLPLKPCSPF